MASPIVPTRQRLTEAGIRRFYRDGFRNVGMDQILADVGISKTALYKHFESKEDLMLEALESQNRWVQETFHQMIRERGGTTAIGQLHAVFDVVEVVIESDDYQGCIFVNAAITVESANLHRAIVIATTPGKLLTNGPFRKLIAASDQSTMHAICPSLLYTLILVLERFPNWVSCWYNNRLKQMSFLVDRSCWVFERDVD